MLCALGKGLAGDITLIKSVQKAIDILSILSANAEMPMTLSALAEQAGINKSTCAHIVDTLCESLYVERVSRTQGYRLGPWAYMLSRYGSYQNGLVTVAAPVLKWLQAKTKATVFISVACNGKKYIIYHIDKLGILERSDGSIIQGRLETTATGMLLMSYMDAETLRHALSRRTDEVEVVTSKLLTDLNKKFKKIRAQGYAYIAVPTNVPEPHQSYAFAVSKGGKVIASLGILYPDVMESPEFKESMIKCGRIAAREISRRLEIK